MGYLNQFPHTNFYESDLGWLIEQYRILNDNYNILVEIYKLIEKDIEDVTIEKLEEWLQDGTFEDIINEVLLKSIETKVDRLINRKFLFIGDSYASTSVFTTKAWYSYVVDFLGLTDGVNSFKSSHGGTGFVSVGDGKTFKTLLETAPIADKENITDVVFIGGYNDQSYSEGLIEYSMKDTFDTCRTLYPNAKILVGMCGWSLIFSEHANLKRIKDVYRNTCITHNVNYLNDVYPSLHAYFKTGNNCVFATNVSAGGLFHPNEKGSSEIAVAVASGILGTRTEKNYGNTLCSFKLPATNYAEGLYTNCNNNVKQYYFYATKITKTANTSLKTNTWFSVGTIENTFIAPKTDAYLQGTCKVNVANVGTFIYPCLIEINTFNLLSIQILTTEVIDYTAQYVIIDIFRNSIDFSIENA